MPTLKWQGRHAVGVCDIEWAADGLKNVKADPIDPTQHVVGRLFYPAAAAGKVPGRGTPWITALQQASGYCEFLFFTVNSWKTVVLKQLLRLALWIAGVTQRLPLLREAPVESGSGPHPVVIFSHGLGGCRGTYAVLCSHLASQGFVVFAVEHADGTASSVQLAGSGGWKYYSGMGPGDTKYDKVRFRQRELATARRLLQDLNAGDTDRCKVALSGSLQSASFLKGALDMERLAAVGHSFGGATVGAAAAKDPALRAAVVLDPWWHGMPPDEAALKVWQTRTPLLIIGSHAWNTPYGDDDKIVCGKEQQEAVLAAARPQMSGEGTNVGGGALLLAIDNSTHDTFSDLPILFATRFSWLLPKLGFVTKLDPKLGMAAVAATTAMLLHRHLPTREAPQLPQLHPASASSAAAGKDIEQPDSVAASADGRRNGGSGNDMKASDSSWSLVSAGDGQDAAATAGGGTGGGGGGTNGSTNREQPAAEVASEATRTDPAIVGSRKDNGSSGTLDPAAGAEAAAGAAATTGSQQTPSATELCSIAGDAPSAEAGRDHNGTSSTAGGEGSKIILTDATKTAIQQLLGDLACILRLSA